jgi:hypothetical protein
MDRPDDDRRGAASLKEDREVRYWCKVLDCSAAQLAEAIARFGYSPEKVRAFLARGTSCSGRVLNELSQRPDGSLPGPLGACP